MTADYSVAPSRSAAITFLSGTVENGAPLDTATLGDKVFTVTAKDSAGQEAELTHTYTVSAAQ